MVGPFVILDRLASAAPEAAALIVEAFVAPAAEAFAVLTATALADLVAVLFVGQVAVVLNAPVVAWHMAIVIPVVAQLLIIVSYAAENLVALVVLLVDVVAR